MVVAVVGVIVLNWDIYLSTLYASFPLYEWKDMRFTFCYFSWYVRRKVTPATGKQWVHQQAFASCQADSTEFRRALIFLARVLDDDFQVLVVELPLHQRCRFAKSGTPGPKVCWSLTLLTPWCSFHCIAVGLCERWKQTFHVSLEATQSAGAVEHEHGEMGLMLGGGRGRQRAQHWPRNVEKAASRLDARHVEIRARRHWCRLCRAAP